MSRRSSNAPNLAELIGSIYDLAGQDGLRQESREGWADTVGRVVSLCDGHSATLRVVHPIEAQSELLGTSLVRPEAVEAYGRHFYRRDVYAQRRREMAARQRMPVEGVHLSQDYLSEAEILRTDYHSEFLRPLCDDIFFNAASTSALSEGRIAVLSLWRKRRQEAFTTEQTEALSQVGPHLGRALALRQKLLGATAERDMGFDALDSMAQPMMLLEADGRIAFINLAAERLIAGADWARYVTGGRLMLRGQAEAQRFAQLLAAALEPATMVGEATMRINGDDSERPIDVLIAPFLPRRQERREGQKQLAVALFSEPILEGDSLARRAAASFGLTPAEAALAADLALGQSPEEIATLRDVRITTIRTQIRAILGKTGASRQSELVRILMRLPRLNELD